VALLAPALHAAPIPDPEPNRKFPNGNECAQDDKIKLGEYVQFHYELFIDESSKKGEHGQMAESSYENGFPYSFLVGFFQVIRGMDQGFKGVCFDDAHTNFTLIIPPDLAYGWKGFGTHIPGDATIRYEIHILDAQDAPFPKRNQFKELDTNEDGYLDEAELLPFFQKRGEETVPANLWDFDDKNQNHLIDWEEFVGPKGDTPEVNPYGYVYSKVPKKAEL